MLPDWDNWFPGCPPVAYLLRDAFPDRWVRFHSLPGSKRYPESEAEYTTLLGRHNRVLEDLHRPVHPVTLLSTGYSDSPQWVRRQPELLSLDPEAVPWRTVAMHELEGLGFDDPTYWHLFASKWEWRAGTFDPLVRLVADDVLANVMMVAVDGRWLLHPYDGGMDVLLDSTAARNRLKVTHPDWLSKRSDGL
jgi:hypothetical protein